MRVWAVLLSIWTLIGCGGSSELDVRGRGFTDGKRSAEVVVSSITPQMAGVHAAQGASGGLPSRGDSGSPLICGGNVAGTASCLVNSSSGPMAYYVPPSAVWGWIQ